MEKIAFIICYNNEIYMNECIKYISDLEVPEDIETDRESSAGDDRESVKASVMSGSDTLPGEESEE